MLNTQESRDGANAGFNAMKIIEHIADNGSPDWTIEDCFTAQRVAVSAALMAAGDVPDRVKGVIAAMAEYIYSTNSAGPPNLDLWKPEAVMTDQEIVENVAKFTQLAED